MAQAAKFKRKAADIVLRTSVKTGVVGLVADAANHGHIDPRTYIEASIGTAAILGAGKAWNAAKAHNISIPKPKFLDALHRNSTKESQRIATYVNTVALDDKEMRTTLVNKLADELLRHDYDSFVYGPIIRGPRTRKKEKKFRQAAGTLLDIAERFPDVLNVGWRVGGESRIRPGRTAGAIIADIGDEKLKLRLIDIARSNLDVLGFEQESLLPSRAKERRSISYLLADNGSERIHLALLDLFAQAKEAGKFDVLSTGKKEYWNSETTLALLARKGSPEVRKEVAKIGFLDKGTLAPGAFGESLVESKDTKIQSELVDHVLGNRDLWTSGLLHDLAKDGDEHVQNKIVFAAVNDPSILGLIVDYHSSVGGNHPGYLGQILAQSRYEGVQLKLVDLAASRPEILRIGTYKYEDSGPITTSTIGALLVKTGSKKVQLELAKLAEGKPEVMASIGKYLLGDNFPEVSSALRR